MNRLLAITVFIVATIMVAGAVLTLVHDSGSMTAWLLIPVSLLVYLVGVVVLRKGVKGLLRAVHDGSPDYTKLK